MKAFDPRHAAKHGYTREDWDAVDSPELTDEELAQARPFVEVFPELAEKMRKSIAGRPKSANPKVAVFATLLIPAGSLGASLAMLVPLIAATGAFYLLLGGGLVRLRLSQRVLWRSLAALLLAFAGAAATAAIR